MKVIWIIATNTYKEIMRDRVLYGLIVFAVFLIGISLALGQLSYAEQKKISVDFGFTAIHISAVMLSIFIGSSLVAKEIDKKTIMTLLARPISRLQFILGKSLGLMLVNLIVMFGLSIILGVIFTGLGVTIDHLFLVGIYGVVLEALILLGVTLMFSSISKPLMVVTFSIGFFLIGHWMNSLQYFAEKSESELFKNFGLGVVKMFPNLEVFNWRSLMVYQETITSKQLFFATTYAIFWYIFFITACVTIFRRKDFV